MLVRAWLGSLLWIGACLALPSLAHAKQVAAAADAPVAAATAAASAYPHGAIAIEVDATALGQHVMRVRQRMPVRPGPLTLLYPQWLPGQHAPRGPIEKLAGLRFTANGKPVTWQRDPINVYAFHLQVPGGVQELIADYRYLSPTDRSQGRVVMTPHMLNLQWNALVLYPAGFAASGIRYDAQVTYPAGWQAATALEVARRQGDTVVYRQVPLDILVDSPVYAGRHFRQFDLAPGAARPVRLNVVADKPAQLAAKPEHIDQHKAMVAQAIKLFGAQHYDHYDFLFSLSSQMSGNGLEHQRSSENGLTPGYFVDWDKSVGSSDLLAHEYVHSWNGKYRRPAGLTTDEYSQPTHNDLLWVYEGQTQYWGNVLNARSGLRPLQASRDALALVAATYADNRPGLQWRNVQDTAFDPIITPRAPKPYRNYQMSEDYYQAGQLIWLEADALIRAATGNRKSLDDFARGFFGINDGEWQTPSSYTFEDVVAALDAVHQHDWAGFLRARLDGGLPLTGGLQAAGWRLVYRDEPSAYAKALARDGSGGDYVYSLGFWLERNGSVGEVRWDGPAFDAGIGTGMQIVAVNDVEYSKDTLDEAVREAKGGSTPIRLLVKDMDRYRTLSIPYYGGLRFPALERIEGRPDYLTPIFTARK